MVSEVAKSTRRIIHDDPIGLVPMVKQIARRSGLFHRRHEAGGVKLSERRVLFASAFTIGTRPKGSAEMVKSFCVRS